MELRINNYTVDLTLEGEKTVADVIRSVNEWARERDLVFIEVSIDDTFYLVDKIPELPIAEVKTINCIVQSRADVCISSINECINYCNKAYSFIEESIQKNNFEMSQIDELKIGIDWIIEVTHKTIHLLDLDINNFKFRDRHIGHYIDELKSFKREIEKGEDVKGLLGLFRDKGMIFKYFTGIFKVLLLGDNLKTLVIQSIDSPDVLINSLLQIKEDIPGQLQNLEDAAVAFQSGKDNEGSARLQTFIDFIYNYSRTCCQVAPVFEIDISGVIIDGVSLEEKNKEIEGLLNEILEVMENNDIISLSDILEYEIRSTLDNLDLYIDSIAEHITEKV